MKPIPGYYAYGVYDRQTGRLTSGDTYTHPARVGAQNAADQYNLYDTDTPSPHFFPVSADGESKGL